MLKDKIAQIIKKYVRYSPEKELQPWTEVHHEYSKNNFQEIDLYIDDSRIPYDTSFLIDTTMDGKSKDYLELRNRQNLNWALEEVKEGIQLAKDKDLEKAIQKYSYALNIHEKCVEAFVARGAALANLGKFEKAMLDFNSALKIDPNHANALSYQSKTKLKIREQDQEKEALISGEFVLPMSISAKDGRSLNSLKPLEDPSAMKDLRQLVSEPSNPNMVHVELRKSKKHKRSRSSSREKKKSKKKSKRH